MCVVCAWEREGVIRYKCAAGCVSIGLDKDKVVFYLTLHQE